MGNFYSVNALRILTPNVLHTSHLPFSCSFKCSNCLPKASRLEKRQTSTDEDADSHGEPPIPAEADTHKKIQKLPISHSSNTMQRDECEKSSGYNLRPQVFLSHSGKQKNFARHLVKEMKRENISCFFDEDPQSLPKGEAFPPRILEAAKNCEVAVVVLSEDFISSKWPMKELCAFVEAKNSSNPSLKILPLFVGMSPDSLAQRLQKKDFLQCWRKLPQSPERPIDFNEWIEALEALRPINGVNYTETEGEVAYIEKTVHHIRRLLPPKLKYEESDVEGKERLCQELAKLFDRIPCRKNEVKVGGLYGVAGIGKTTISRILCNFYFTDFHGRVFHVELGRHPTIETLKHALRNLCDATESRVNSVTCLEDGGRLLKDMMYGKKVFLAVDNISDLPESIKEARMYLSAVCSAGKQSMILLTSRSSTILRRFIPEESDLLHVPSLEEEEAIAVLLQGTPLELSELTVEQKDIARKCVQKCCFGWQSYGISAHHRQYHPLVLRILGAFIYDKFQYHSWADLSAWIDERSTSWRGSKQEVFQMFDESFRRLSVQRRRIFVLLSLYLPESHMTLEAICDWLVFVCDQEVEDIESAIIELKRKGFIGSTQESRFGLYIHDLLIEFAESLADGTGECISLKGKVEIPATLQVALSSDRPMFWAMKFDNCHLQSTGMVNNELFTNILVLHLKDMRGTKTVDLSAMKILRSITIVGCSGLEEVRGLESLRGLGYFILKDCTVNARFYSEIQCLKSLRHLEVAGSPWEAVIRSLQGPWASFPPLQGLSNLGTIYADDLRHGTGSLDLTGFSKLQTVWLSRCNIIRLDFSGCLELRTINIRGCYNLSEIRLFNPLCSTMNLFSRAGYANLTDLRLSEMGNLKELPSLSGLTHLTSLELRKMVNLKELPSLSGLTHLTDLGLCDMGNLKELPSLSGLPHLTSLRLWEIDNLKELPSLSELTHLTALSLGEMGNLEELPNLSGLTHLTELRLWAIDNLQEIPSLNELTHLNVLFLGKMGNLKGLPSLSELTHLTGLFLGEEVGNTKELPGLRELTDLTWVRLEDMPNLEELPDFARLRISRDLQLRRCVMREFPNLTNCFQIRIMKI